MGTWVIENKTKILNLLGLRENPGIRFPYEFAHSLRLVTLIKNNNENNNNVTKLKQTIKQTLTFKTPRLTAKLSLLKRVFCMRIIMIFISISSHLASP